VKPGTASPKSIDGAASSRPQLRAKQRAMLEPILDAWMAGKVPQPEALAPIAGPVFVKTVRERLSGLK
jgi:hypothetical protein